MPYLSASSLPSVWYTPSAGPSTPPIPPPHVSTTSCRVARAVPEDREQAAHRVDLEVREPGRDLDLFQAERFEELER